MRECYPCNARTSGLHMNKSIAVSRLTCTVDLAGAARVLLGASLSGLQWKATMDVRLPSLLIQSLHGREGDQAEGYV
jgi:hypothetical protein